LVFFLISVNVKILNALPCFIFTGRTDYRSGGSRDGHQSGAPRPYSGRGRGRGSYNNGGGSNSGNERRDSGYDKPRWDSGTKDGDEGWGSFPGAKVQNSPGREAFPGGWGAGASSGGNGWGGGASGGDNSGWGHGTDGGTDSGNSGRGTTSSKRDSALRGWGAAGGGNGNGSDSGHGSRGGGTNDENSGWGQ